jgi:hypothetical protein
VTGLWFSLGTPLSSTNKTDCHDIAEIFRDESFPRISAFYAVVWVIFEIGVNPLRKFVEGV